MKHFLLFFLIFFSAISWNCDNNNEPEAEDTINAELKAYIKDSLYMKYTDLFVSDSIEGWDSIYHVIYAGLLHYFDEESFLELGDTVEAYRFYFDNGLTRDPPVVFTLRLHKNEKGMCSSISYNVKSGDVFLDDYVLPIEPKFYSEEFYFDDGFLLYDLHRNIYPERQVYYDTIQYMLNELDFWNQSETVEWYGCDGDNFYIEGLKNGKYHIIHRWSPNKENKGVEIKAIYDFLYSLVEFDLGVPEDYSLND